MSCQVKSSQVKEVEWPPNAAACSPRRKTAGLRPPPISNRSPCYTQESEQRTNRFSGSSPAWKTLGQPTRGWFWAVSDISDAWTAVRKSTVRAAASTSVVFSPALRAKSQAPRTTCSDLFILVSTSSSDQLESSVKNKTSWEWSRLVEIGTATATGPLKPLLVKFERCIRQRKFSGFDRK